MSKRSKWKTGEEIKDEEGIKDIELFKDYIRKGVQPYNKAGRPISPSDILETVPKSMKSRLKRYGSESNEDSIEYKMEHIERTFKPILREKKYLDNWTEFKLPDDDSEITSLFHKLRDCLYLKDDIKKFSGSPNLENDKKKPAKALRQSRKDMLEVQRVAKELFKKYPEFDTIKEFRDLPEIMEAGGRHYQPSTRHKWISKVAPKRLTDPGIRPKKK